MIILRSPVCLSRLSPHNPSRIIIEELIDQVVQESKRTKHHWVFEQDGGFILVQPEDMSTTLAEFHPGKTLSTLPYEGVHIKDGHYIGVTLLNNQASLVWIIPDAAWLPDELRNVLEDNRMPSTENPSNQP
jgi:hypothetical protein